MIWRLFRQDPAIRTLSVSCAIAITIGFWIFLWRERLPAWTTPEAMGGKAGWLDFGIALAWFFLMLLVATAKITVRSGFMNLALPVRPRVLWGVRMAAILAAALLPLVVITAVVAVRDSIGGSLVIDGYILAVGGQIASGLVLVVFLLQQPFASVCRIEWGWAYTVYGLIMALGVLAVVLASPVTWLSIVIPLALALVLAAGLYRRLPESFSVVDAHPEGEEFEDDASANGRMGESARRRQGDAATGRLGESPTRTVARSGLLQVHGAAPFRRLLHLTALRILVNQWQTWLFLLGVLMYAFILGNSFREGKELFPFVLFPAAWMYGVIGTCARRLSSLDPLPISRRRLFLYPAVSALLFFAMGLGLAEIRQAAGPHPPRMINYHGHELHTPDEFCEIAWDGVVPEVSSPWGERYTPNGHRAIPWSPAVVYDPFEHGPDSSPKFIALQIDRAIEAVHGVPVPAKYADPDYRLAGGYVDAIRRGAFTVEGSRGRTSDVRSETYSLGAILAVLVLAPVYVLALLGQSGTPRGKVFRLTAVGFLVFVVGVMVAAVILEGLGVTKAWAIGAFPWILLRHLASKLPLDPAVIWVLVFAALGAAFFSVRWAFDRMEAPVRAQPSGFVQEY